MTKQQVFNGWFMAFFSVLVLWGLNNVMIGYSAQILNANYLVYTCSAFASCALILLIIGGKGPLVRETLRSIDTWAFGCVMLIGYVLTLSLFSYVTSTEGSLLQRISLLFSIGISWLFLSRKATNSQLLGAGIVLLGIIIVCRELPKENQGIIYLLMFLEGLALTARMFIAEIHRPHQQAVSLESDPRAKARVVGFVMFVISTLFLSVLFLLALLQSFSATPLDTSLIPNLDSFTHTPSIFAGLVAGVFLLAPLRMIEFSATNIIKTENFLAVAALSSVGTLFWEWLLHPLTGMSLHTISSNDIWALAIITLGALVAALGKVKQSTSPKTAHWEEYLAYQPQNLGAIDDSREMIANTLEHYSGDLKKSARALSVPVPIIQALIDDVDKVLSFKEQPLRHIAREYRKKVAMSDALTGLANRSAFMTALKTAPYEKESFSILYIDLDKFKPVNDTHGHEAGDKVLQMVAHRLKRVSPKQSIITRMGGDEYCILLLDSTPQTTAKMVKTLKEEISQPYKIDGIKESILISASIGLANYPEDGSNPEELLAIADQGMFGVKHSRD